MRPSPISEEDSAALYSGRAARLFAFGRVLFWVIVGVALTAWFLVSLSWPLGGDQGVFASVGHVIRLGGMPYKDAWEVKGPTAFLPYALIELIVGRTMWGIRVFDLLMTAGSMIAVYQICKVWRDRRAGWYAVVILSFTALTMDFFTSAQPDNWCAGLIAIAVAVLAGGVRQVSMLRYAVAGACVATCVLEKPLFLMYGLLLVPPLVWKWRAGDLLRPIAAALIGFLIPVAALVAWLSARGALSATVDTYVLYDLRVHAQNHVATLQSQFSNLTFWFRSMPPLSTFMLPALLGGFVLMRWSKIPALLFAFWFGLGLASVIVQRKYFAYHWFPLFPCLAAGTAMALRHAEAMLVLTSRRWGIRFSVTHFAFLWFALLYLPFTSYPVRQWLSYATGHISKGQYLSDFGVNRKGNYWFPRIQAIADYVHERTTPDQPVLVWGFEAGINYLSDRLSPSRFEYAYPLQAAAGGPFRTAYRVEFMEKVRAHPPAYIVVADLDGNLLIGASSKQALDGFPELKELMRERYTLETTIYDWDLWRLKS